MADKYDYHKRNDYPGQRIAERKRVADRADEEVDDLSPLYEIKDRKLRVIEDLWC